MVGAVDLGANCLRYLYDVGFQSVSPSHSFNRPISSGSAIELTWNHWSSPVSKIELKPVQGNAEKDTPITLPEQYVLRPIWQRGGLCIAHFGFGVAIAVALLVTQARFVRTLAIVPASSFANQGSSAENRHVFLQCAHHFRKNGMVFPLNKCSLQEGRNETELVFRVTGDKGHWYVGLDNGTIYGRRVSPLEARNSILESWGGKRVGHWTQKYVADSRWKSGPIRRLEH